MGKIKKAAAVVGLSLIMVLTSTYPVYANPDMSDIEIEADEDLDLDFKGWDDQETQENTWSLLEGTNWDAVIDENATITETTGSADGDDSVTGQTSNRQKVLKDYLVHQEVEADAFDDAWDDSDATNAVGFRAQVVAYAKKWIGNPYVYGGVSLTNGADCSGFQQSVFKHFNITLPRVAQDQYNASTKVSKENLKPGDLVFYLEKGSTTKVGHVAMYIGNNQIVHAGSPATGIHITNNVEYRAVAGYGTYIDDSKYPSLSDSDTKFLQCLGTYALTKQPNMTKSYMVKLLYTMQHQAKKVGTSIEDTCKANIEAFNYGAEDYSLSTDTDWNNIIDGYPGSVNSTVKTAMSQILDATAADTAKTGSTKKKWIYWYPYDICKTYGIVNQAKNDNKKKNGCFFEEGLVIPDTSE